MPRLRRERLDLPAPGRAHPGTGTDAKGRRQYRYHDVVTFDNKAKYGTRRIQSIVDPRVVDRYQAGLTVARALEAIGEDVAVGQPSTQGAIERAVLALLADDAPGLKVAA